MQHQFQKPLGTESWPGSYYCYCTVRTFCCSNFVCHLLKPCICSSEPAYGGWNVWIFIKSLHHWSLLLSFFFQWRTYVYKVMSDVMPVQPVNGIFNEFMMIDGSSTLKPHCVFVDNLLELSWQRAKVMQILLITPLLME